MSDARTPHGHTAFSVERVDDGTGSGQLVLRRAGTQVGSLEYRRSADGAIIIDFVEIDPALQGAGLGRRLVEAAVGWARESHTSIVPLCSYSRSVIEGDRKLRDVLK